MAGQYMVSASHRIP